MSGHTAQVLHLKKFITADTLYKFNWILSHIRNIIIVIILFLSWKYIHVRESFGRSAIGHIGYILVRAGPVFRLGSVYVGDKALWQSLTDIERVNKLLHGNHIFLTIEVCSLLFLCFLFFYWKISFGLQSIS